MSNGVQSFDQDAWDAVEGLPDPRSPAATSPASGLRAVP
jgi:hypothetical protein